MKDYFKDAGWTGAFYIALYGGSWVALLAMFIIAGIRRNFF